MRHLRECPESCGSGLRGVAINEVLRRREMELIELIEILENKY